MLDSKDFLFTKDHEWLCKKGDEIVAGITAYAVEELGDIVYVELPEVGAIFACKEVFGTVESTKTVSDLYMPSGGEVVAINDEAIKNPELLHEESYDKCWLIKYSPTEELNIADYLTQEDYEKYIKSAVEGA